ncbi:MAG TPA: hypothetical protein VNL37_06845 [Candidatus Polarisedimenticolia bacterium]|nr:hypothetical protein [Candidatus Polarisedimenticolia bacterium]
MKPRPRRAAVRPLLALPLGLVALLAFPSPARALGDYIGGEAAPWFQNFSGEMAINDGSVNGTLVDFKDTLGLDNRDTAQMGRVWVRWSKRNRLIFDYADTTRSGSAVLAQNFTFNGTTYGAGETVRTDLELKLVQARTRFTFVNLKIVEAAFDLGVDLAKVDVQVNGSTTGHQNLSQNVPYPIVGASVVVKPLPGFHIRAEADGLSVNVSGNSVDTLDARVQLEYYFMHVFGLFGGYRSFHASVDANDFGHVENRYQGPYVGLAVKF